MHKMILGAVAEATEMDCNIYHSHLSLNFDGKLMLFFRIYLLLKQYVLVRQEQRAGSDYNEKAIKD